MRLDVTSDTKLHVVPHLCGGADCAEKSQRGAGQPRVRSPGKRVARVAPVTENRNEDDVEAQDDTPALDIVTATSDEERETPPARAAPTGGELDDSDSDSDEQSCRHCRPLLVCCWWIRRPVNLIYGAAAFVGLVVILVFLVNLCFQIVHEMENPAPEYQENRSMSLAALLIYCAAVGLAITPMIAFLLLAVVWTLHDFRSTSNVNHPIAAEAVMHNHNMGHNYPYETAWVELFKGLGLVAMLIGAPGFMHATASGATDYVMAFFQLLSAVGIAFVLLFILVSFAVGTWTFCAKASAKWNLLTFPRRCCAGCSDCHQRASSTGHGRRWCRGCQLADEADSHPRVATAAEPEEEERTDAPQGSVWDRHRRSIVAATLLLVVLTMTAVVLFVFVKIGGSVASVILALLVVPFTFAWMPIAFWVSPASLSPVVLRAKLPELWTELGRKVRRCCSCQCCSGNTSSEAQGSDGSDNEGGHRLWETVRYWNDARALRLLELEGAVRVCSRKRATDIHPQQPDPAADDSAEHESRATSPPPAAAAASREVARGNRTDRPRSKDLDESQLRTLRWYVCCELWCAIPVLFAFLAFVAFGTGVVGISSKPLSPTEADASSSSRRLQDLSPAVAANATFEFPSYTLCNDRWGGLTPVDMSMFALFAHLDRGNVTGTESDLNDYFRGESEPAASDRADWIIVHSSPEESPVHFVHFYSASRNQSIVSVRGSVGPRDWWENTDIWSEALLLQLASLVIPIVEWWDISVTARFVQVTSNTEFFFHADGPARYTNTVEHYVEEVLAAPEDFGELRLVGHSLGGGVAKIVGARNGVDAVSFGSPGIKYEKLKFDFTEEAVDRHVYTVAARHDIIPWIDQHGGSVHAIHCRHPSQSTLQCHSIRRYVCELALGCGVPISRIHRVFECAPEFTANS